MQYRKTPLGQPARNAQGQLTVDSRVQRTRQLFDPCDVDSLVYAHKTVISKRVFHHCIRTGTKRASIVCRNSANGRNVNEVLSSFARGGYCYLEAANRSCRAYRLDVAAMTGGSFTPEHTRSSTGVVAKCLEKRRELVVVESLRWSKGRTRWALWVAGGSSFACNVTAESAC
jgi:hypothetical protein